MGNSSSRPSTPTCPATCRLVGFAGFVGVFLLGCGGWDALGRAYRAGCVSHPLGAHLPSDMQAGGRVSPGLRQLGVHWKGMRGIPQAPALFAANCPAISMLHTVSVQRLQAKINIASVNHHRFLFIKTAGQDFRAHAARCPQGGYRQPSMPCYPACCLTVPCPWLGGMCSGRCCWRCSHRVAVCAPVTAAAWPTSNPPCLPACICALAGGHCHEHC